MFPYEKQHQEKHFKSLEPLIIDWTQSDLEPSEQTL